MIASEPTASLVGVSRTLEREEPAREHQHPAAEREAEREPEQRVGGERRRLRVPFAAFEDEPDDRLRQHRHRRAGGDQQQGDLPHPGADRGAHARVVGARGQPGELREQHGRDRDGEHPLREHVDPEGGVDRARHLVGDAGADDRVQQQVDVDQPEADRDREHQQQHAPDALVVAPWAAGCGRSGSPSGAASAASSAAARACRRRRRWRRRRAGCRPRTAAPARPSRR